MLNNTDKILQKFLQPRFPNFDDPYYHFSRLTYMFVHEKNQTNLMFNDKRLVIIYAIHLK